MIPVLYAVLGVAFVLFAVALGRGPGLDDRMVAIDGMLWTAVAVLVVRAVDTGDGFYLPVPVVLTLVAFISTGIVSRFIEGRNR